MSRRIVVTGGASGIGATLARRFAAEGSRVAVCDSDPEAVAAMKDVTLAQVADVRDEAQMFAFLDRVETAWGGVDVLCANAGTGGPAAPIEAMELADWRDCISVNLDGAFFACRWAARIMKAQGSGVIVLTSSTSGLHGHPTRSPYAAAKWGLIGLTKTLAMELGAFGVRVNAICPGAVKGPRMERMLVNEAAATGRDVEEIRQGYASGTSLGTWVTADDVADAALFLASDAARRITGQAIPVDGYTERMR